MAALDQLGTLYRNADGVEVWAIRNTRGEVIADNITSDADAAFVAEGALAASRSTASTLSRAQAGVARATRSASSASGGSTGSS